MIDRDHNSITDKTKNERKNDGFFFLLLATEIVEEFLSNLDLSHTN